MTPASPSPLSFGDQDVDAGATPSRTVLVTNTGSAPIAVTATIINGPGAAHFSITDLPPATPFSPGDSRAVGVAFDPAGPGALTATLELTTMNAVDDWTVGVPLIGRGSGDAGIVVTPLSLAFGSQSTEAGPTGSQAVFITNPGVTDRSISSLTLTGAAPSEFTIVSDSGEGTLTRGASRTVRVAFDPSATGLLAASLNIVSNDNAQGTVGVTLTGTGVAPEIPPRIPPEITARCFGVQATIVGTDGPDRLNGTPGRDIIAGLGGNDVINGRGGNDLLCGGKGADRIRGGTGKDRLDGGSGRDKLDGGADSDRCIGGSGTDTARNCERFRGIP